MAGNVREWSATATGPDRITLGGAWSDPSYIYLIPEARPPFDRGAENGFRCIRRLEQGELSPLALAPIEKTGWRDFSLERPVKDELYTTFERFFDKERVALEPRIESTDDSAERWIKQKVSYAAGYGDERLVAWLYLPRNATPPYQAIIQMGGVESFFPGSSEAEGSIFGTHSENILRGGRAILLPLWKGSYERWDGFHPLDSSAAVFREHAIQWVSELRRSVDYLQSRDDIDPERIGYQGISYGAVWGPMFLALEKRLRVGLLICGGFNTHVGRYLLPPEIDVLNYAPRVTAPVLMLNGRHDPLFPYVTSQLPMFLALGPSEEDKRHVTFPGGHYSSGWMDHLIRESLDWLDRHLGEPLPAT
jgi:pimeloyl-ACP methyl ester carboxylesterase